MQVNIVVDFYVVSSVERSTTLQNYNVKIMILHFNIT